MNVTFTPFEPDAAAFLTEETATDFLRTDFTRPHWLCVTVRRDDDSLMAVAACEFKEWFNAHFSVAIADQRAITQRLLRTIFSTLFSQAVRVTALVDPDNERAISICRRLGFVYEGFLRMGVEGRRDALIFGMLREDCRFLPGYEPIRRSVPSIPLGGYHGFQS
jgi:hypothetical protein